MYKSGKTFSACLLDSTHSNIENIQPELDAFALLSEPNANLVVLFSARNNTKGITVDIRSKEILTILNNRAPFKLIERLRVKNSSTNHPMAVYHFQRCSEQ
jgi:hypothetical protein